MLRVIKRKATDRGAVSAVEMESGGPAAEFLELWSQPDYKEYWDDVNGGFLDRQLVREARLLELDWIKEEKVYDYRLWAEAERKGIKPTPLIWVDTNKGDRNKPFVRSRMCVSAKRAVTRMSLWNLSSCSQLCYRSRPSNGFVL